MKIVLDVSTEDEKPNSFVTLEADDSSLIAMSVMSTNAEGKKCAGGIELEPKEAKALARALLSMVEAYE